MKTGLSFLILALFAANVSAQSYHTLANSEIVKIPEVHKSKIRDIIRIPNPKGYYTLKCDLHSHTVFSDGDLWPSARVHEAWRQGLDAIAITDHIEYRPHKMITSDHNESCKIAQAAASGIDIIVIKGSEITRSKPLGHLNALFITDANALDIPEPLDAIDTALKQGAFILWNHPGWPDNKSTLYPVHEKLINEKKIHGVEVFNYDEYYPVAIDWCRDKGLAFSANSDIHYIVDGDYGNSIRPMTLVFATERSEKGIRDALFAGRTGVSAFDKTPIRELLTDFHVNQNIKEPQYDLFSNL
ncbi:MAG: PHP domain-containing protein [Prevotellaceae bacterium]|jgi:predicted metal-dependent phosphoesterase TrpH|nr:PHP domain-containing protein [Prevotellaceae bacterium]